MTPFLLLYEVRGRSLLRGVGRKSRFSIGKSARNEFVRRMSQITSVNSTNKSNTTIELLKRNRMAPSVLHSEVRGRSY